MPVIEGGYVNPYYQEVDEMVARELKARGGFYGARVRSSRHDAASFPRNLAWSYQKVAYVRVTPVDGGPVLGGAYSRVMSDRKGELTLYDSTRNQPKYPLLQSLEISNEGTIGSLLKGKFSFTVYPDLYKTGFRIETLEESYFKPGKEVTIQWGWSTYADNSESNTGKMSGIIYNFDWQVNQDLSITANCSIVSKASIAVGLSGEQTNPQQDEEDTKDPLGNPVPNSDLAGIIELDMSKLKMDSVIRSLVGSSLSLGQKRYIDKTKTHSGRIFNPYGLGYYAIAVPKSKQDSAIGDGEGGDGEEMDMEAMKKQMEDALKKQDNKPKKAKPPVVEPIYYIPLKDITELINGLMTFGYKMTGIAPLYKIMCDGNVTEHYKDSIVSCAPERVFFPDDWMGNYGAWKPFESDSDLTKGTDGKPLRSPTGDRLVNIGNILISTNVIIETYRKFVKENQTNIAYKNISSFINELIKEVNYASGEVYQLSARLIEPEMLSSKTRKGKSTDPAILSIEDSNLAASVVAEITPFWLVSDISAPLIKNMSISAKPPATMAAAAYAEARGKQGPQQTDVRTAKDKDIDTSQYDKEFNDAKKTYEELKWSFMRTGAGDKFTTDMKGAFAKYKRASRGAPGIANGSHWLNRALYPVELSLTLDGINGFKFGDVIKTNLIPKMYNEKETDMVFVITKITHTIQNGSWETVLNTKSRINMGQSSPDTFKDRP